MTTNTNLSNYIFYLQYVNKKLENFFKQQEPYIMCKKGCSKCCENGEYPFSKLEFDYLMVGFLQLPYEVQEKINAKIKKLKEEKEKYSGEKAFVHECPFLVNKSCSVYEYRGITCRSFGLMSINEKGNSKIPFCAFEGLNYSSVIDKETSIISSEKYEKLGIAQEPLAYNVSYDFLTSENISKNFEIDFGDKKALLDWC